MESRQPKPTPNQHPKWDFSNKAPEAGKDGRWVTINGAHVFIPADQGGKAEMNHTPHNVVDKPASHAPGHENHPMGAGRQPHDQEPHPGIPSTTYHFGEKGGKPSLRTTILNARELGMTVEQYRKHRDRGL